MRDPGWICFFGVLAAVAAFVIVPISCATTSPKGFRFEECTQPRQSVDGTVLQTCNFDPIQGASMCWYNVVRTPLSCRCREWRIRLTCDGEFGKYKRECVCNGSDHE